MSDPAFVAKYIARTVELDGNPITEAMISSFFNDEIGAHTFDISGRQGGEPVAFSGTVTAVFLNANDEIINLNGAAVNGAARVTLTDACYQLSGRFILTISVNGKVVYCCQSRIVRRSSNNVYVPDSSVDIAVLRNDVNSLMAAYGNKKVKIVAGTIRRGAQGWYFISDSEHNPMNAASVEETESGFVKIHYGFTASRVISMVITPDDTFVRYYDVGASVGLNYAQLVFFSKKNYLADYIYYDTATQSFKSTTGDIIATSIDGYRVTLTHRAITGGDNHGVSVVGKGCVAVMDGTTASTIEIGFIGPNWDYVTTFTASYRAYVYRPLPYEQSVSSVDLTNNSGNFWFMGIFEVA